MSNGETSTNLSSVILVGPELAGGGHLWHAEVGVLYDEPSGRQPHIVVDKNPAVRALTQSRVTTAVSPDPFGWGWHDGADPPDNNPMKFRQPMLMALSVRAPAPDSDRNFSNLRISNRHRGVLRKHTERYFEPKSSIF